MFKTKVIQIDPGNPDPVKIDEAADILRNGGLVAFPTETVYGLAALINHQEARDKLSLVKERPAGKKFSVCVYHQKQVEQLVGEVSPLAYRLMKKFWPGPLTLVLKAADQQTIGFRFPEHSVAQALLRRLPAPVFAPSANLAGKESPVRAEDVLKDLNGKIDAVIDSGKSALGIVSTVCAVDQDKIEILRPGAISEEILLEESKVKNILFVCTGNSCRSPMAEGLMKKIIGDNKYINVSSAGIAAYDGMRASREAIDVLRQEGINISEHRARQVNVDMVKDSDYILVMEQRHKRWIIDKFPFAQERIFALREFDPENNGNLSIPDPIGLDLRFYEQVAAVIKDSIERLVAKIQ
ncbi:MAG: L-threonylcarbamoyladenylate synthase [Candidatus Omnitrophota bacterium]